MRKLFLLLPALLLALSGCATKGGAPFSEAQVEAGKALVYIYRDDTVDGEWLPEVWIPGTAAPSFDLPNRRYAAVNLAPGKHVVKAMWVRRSDIPEAETTITVEPNQTYYVRVLYETHDGALGKSVVFYMNAKTAVRAVPREEAMKSLPKTKSAR
jgi:hypothetical protein